MSDFGPLVDPRDAPEFLRELIAATGDVDPEVFRRYSPEPSAGSRCAAVLVLFGIGADGEPDLLLTRRADTLGSHAGQVAFPGGGSEAGDDGPVATALREAAEEVGLRSSAVQPLALLPTLHVPVSRYTVTPVLGYWSRPEPVGVMDPAET
ncbi:MAG: NUDIX hydrolase, partial [Sciscionella sp.]